MHCMNWKECPWVPTLGFQHADPETQTVKRGNNRMVWGEKKLSENKSAFSGPISQPAHGWEAETSSRPKLRAVKIKNPIYHLHFVNSYTPFWASQVAQW